MDLSKVFSAAKHALQAGDAARAQALFKRTLEIDPTHSEANHHLGVIFARAQDWSQALTHLRRALEGRPREASIWLHYVQALWGSGQKDAARATLLQAVDQGLSGTGVDQLRQRLGIRSDVPAEYVVGIHAMMAIGNWELAERLAQRLTATVPGYVAGWTVLAGVLRLQRKYELAEPALLRALQLEPQAPDAWCNLGANTLDRGQPAVAAEHFSRAVSLNRQFPEAHYFLGNCQAALGQLDQAIESYAQALALQPHFFEACFNLAKLCSETKQWQRAAAAFDQASKLNPTHAESYIALSQALIQLESWSAAIDAARAAAALEPENPHIDVALSAALKASGDTVGAQLAAQRSQEKALVKLAELEPDNPEVLSNLGVFYAESGQYDKAISSYGRAIELAPAAKHANDYLLCALAWQEAVSPSEYLIEAQKWEIRVIPESLREVARSRKFAHLPLGSRPLRVGYVSGDFRHHAISYFMEAIFACHARSGVELFAFSNHATGDEVTDRLRACCTGWVDISGLSDEAAAGQILDRRVDVLVDLSGYTALNRMGVFARRVAPVQAHYLGYFGSTGLTEMDYWIGDEVLIPDAQLGQFSEQVWRLPRVYCCYRGRDDAPEPRQVPASDGSIRFGSFNSRYKLTPRTIALWARLLLAVPGSVLLLKSKSLGDDAGRATMEAAFMREGIGSERLRLLGATAGWSEHMATYDQIDIALDPVGAHTGVTTTCDALWMGVPVVTLAGDRVSHRWGASILSAIGRRDWVADTEDAYIRIAVALAQAKAERDAIRMNQRAHMRAAPLCDAYDMTLKLEAAFAAMYQAWESKR